MCCQREGGRAGEDISAGIKDRAYAFDGVLTDTLTQRMHSFLERGIRERRSRDISRRLSISSNIPIKEKYIEQKRILLTVKGCNGG